VDTSNYLVFASFSLFALPQLSPTPAPPHRFDAHGLMIDCDSPQSRGDVCDAGEILELKLLRKYQEYAHVHGSLTMDSFVIVVFQFFQISWLSFDFPKLPK
jgi:hypothetical protein